MSKKENNKSIHTGFNIEESLINDFRKLCSCEFDDVSKRIRRLIKNELLLNRNKIKNPESEFLKS